MIKEIILDALDLTNSNGNRISKTEEEHEWEWQRRSEGRVRQKVS